MLDTVAIICKIKGHRNRVYTVNKTKHFLSIFFQSLHLYYGRIEQYHTF
jgi:hypothetical protein